MYDLKYTYYLCNITLYLIVKIFNLKRLENRDEDYSPTFVGDDGGGGLPDRLGDPPAQLLDVLLELLLVHLALEDEGEILERQGGGAGLRGAEVLGEKIVASLGNEYLLQSVLIC